MAPELSGNPMATIAQLESSASQADGIPKELEDSVQFAGARLTQLAGILLRLPQDTVAIAIVNLTRFWVGPDGGSMLKFDAKNISAASTYLTAKLSPYPKSPRSVINVYAYLDAHKSTFEHNTSKLKPLDPDTYFVSEGTYQARRLELMRNEALLLRVIGFQTDIQLPHTLSVNYLQTLDVFADHAAGSAVAKRTFAHLNSALFSPQKLYLTHQPSALATAAIYLAAHEEGVKLAGENWWEVFDTDREQLGYLVFSLHSHSGFAVAEKEKWEGKLVPMTAQAVRREVEQLDRSS